MLEIEMARRDGVGDVLRAEAVVPHEPVRLIQPMLAHQRRRAIRQARRRVRDRAERGVIDAAQPIRAIQRVGRRDDVRIRARVGADDELRALAGGRELRRALAAFGGFIDTRANRAHRAS